MFKFENFQVYIFKIIFKTTFSQIGFNEKKIA